MTGYFDRGGRYHPGTGRWWAYSAPRRTNSIGMTPELPAGRAGTVAGWTR